jgi:hypothetical protein
MACECIRKINQQLEPHGLSLCEAFDLSGKKQTLLEVATARIDGGKRKPATHVFATYCPFCGKKLNDEGA